MFRTLILILASLCFAACNESAESDNVILREEANEEDEIAVIHSILKGYSLGKNSDIPAAFSSLLGTAKAQQLATLDPLRLEFVPEITESMCADLVASGVDYERDDRIGDSELLEALESLRIVNREQIEIDKIGDIATVPVARLNQAIVDIEGRIDPSGDFWKEFDDEFPDYAGYASASRVGFSSDRRIAVVYFSWLAGPTLGRGGFHILKRNEKDWIYVGCFSIWGWIS